MPFHLGIYVHSVVNSLYKEFKTNWIYLSYLPQIVQK